MFYIEYRSLSIDYKVYIIINRNYLALFHFLLMLLIARCALLMPLKCFIMAINTGTHQKIPACRIYNKIICWGFLWVNCLFNSKLSMCHCPVCIKNFTLALNIWTSEPGGLWHFSDSWKDRLTPICSRHHILVVWSIRATLKINSDVLVILH